MKQLVKINTTMPIDGEKTDSLRNQVYENLCEKFHSGELLPGSLIDQKKICAELGISRTPLNNALLRLDAEGIVTIHPRSKVVVNRLEEKDIEYLYAIIGSIETLLITNGLANYTEAVLQKMNCLNETMIEAVSDGNLPSYNDAHYQFHHCFLEMAPNLFAERILYPIKNRLWDFPKKHFSTRWHLHACDEHQIIIDAISDQNIARATDCLNNFHWNFKYNREYINQAYYL